MQTQNMRYSELGGSQIKSRHSSLHHHQPQNSENYNGRRNVQSIKSVLQAMSDPHATVTKGLHSRVRRKLELTKQKPKDGSPPITMGVFLPQNTNAILHLQKKDMFAKNSSYVQHLKKKIHDTTEPGIQLRHEPARGYDFLETQVSRNPENRSYVDMPYLNNPRKRKIDPENLAQTNDLPLKQQRMISETLPLHDVNRGIYGNFGPRTNSHGDVIPVRQFLIPKTTSAQNSDKEEPFYVGHKVIGNRYDPLKFGSHDFAVHNN